MNSIKRQDFQQRLFLLIFAFLSACAGQVHEDYNANIDFSSLKTYAWRSLESPVTDSLMDQRIRSATEASLTKAGYRKVSRDKADMLIAYRYVVTEKEAVDRGPRVGIGVGSRGTFGGISFGVGDYEMEKIGTLTINILSATHQLIWQGYVHRSFTGSNPNQITRKINNAISLIIAKFPPKQKGK